MDFSQFGHVFYGISDTDTQDLASQMIQLTFGEDYATFSASFVFVATWDRVSNGSISNPEVCMPTYSKASS